MPRYEVKTTYREVGYGNCWLHIEADSEEEALFKLKFGSFDDYEVDECKQTDCEDFQPDGDDIYFIKRIDTPETKEP